MFSSPAVPWTIRTRRTPDAGHRPMQLHEAGTDVARSKFVIVIAALALLSSGAAALEINVFGNKAAEGISTLLNKAIEKRDTLFGNVSEEDEARMGASAASVLLGAAPLVDDAALQRYVNKVGLWIALQTERPNLNWRFGVLEDDTVNAFAAPSGYVFITRGLFRVLRNEAELAGVLAHEIAHVVAKHHVEAMVKQDRFQVLAETAQSVSGDDSWMADAALSASRKIYASGLDKSVEFEADRMGVVLAARAGYDAYGLMHTLMTLDGAGKDSEFMGYFLSTHPATGERIEALSTLLDKNVKGHPGRAPEGTLASHQKRLN